MNETKSESQIFEETVPQNGENSNAEAYQEVNSPRRVMPLIDDLYDYCCFLGDTVLDDEVTIEVLERILKIKEKLKNGKDN